LYKRCKLQTQKPFNTPSCSKARFMPVRVRTVTPASGRNRLSMAGCSPAKVLWAVKELFVNISLQCPAAALVWLRCRGRLSEKRVGG
jgi:hypothetical protein